MNNPDRRRPESRSGFADPDSLRAMAELTDAEYKKIEDKVKILDQELHEYFVLRAQAHDLRVQHAVVALVEVTARSIVMASAMSPAFTHNLRGYLEFFDEVVGASANALEKSPVGQIIAQLFGGKIECSKDSSSEEASSPSSSTSAESPSSSPGESKDA